MLKSDVSVAKNYLVEGEIKELERVRVDVSRLRRESGRAGDPDEDVGLGRRLDAFLQFNEYEVLTNAGKVSAEVAKRLAEEQYDKFRVRQDREFESDFEAEVKRIESKRPRKKTEES
jgi:hypothetical protein